MGIFESVKIALGAIWVNKMRSLLTMLGIIIGISSVITIVSLGNGVEKAMNSEFAKLGINRIMITHNWDNDLYYKDYMKVEDAKAIERAFAEEFQVVQPTFSGRGIVNLGSGKANQAQLSITGAGMNYQKLQPVELVRGRFISEADVDADRFVMVIDEGLAMKAFNTLDAVGKQVVVETEGQTLQFVVVGVAKKTGGFMGMGDESHATYIPIYRAQKIYGWNDAVWQIEGAVNLDQDAEAVLKRVVSLLDRRHGTVGKNNYRYYNMESEMSTVTNVLTGVTAVISAIAAVSLLVGGIGVMNIMLVSVTERTREIGIRKALGAKYKEIMSQFLIEAVIISTIGGIIGTVLGIGLSVLIASAVPFLPGANASLTSIVVACLFSAGVGIVFGIFPASKAAKLNPIDALRYE